MTAAAGSPSYRFVRELASGGMGRIELVVRREGAFARPYARKRLLPQFAGDPHVRAMFLEEARVAGLVRHANVVGVLDVGEDDEGPYLVMDLVDGVPLLEVLESFGATLPVQVAVEIGRQVAEGLDAAHELVAPDGRAMELVHRDVSLTNVLVGFDGTVRVVDFGVARAVDRGSLTRVGTLKGRLSYMPSEQLEHRPLDRRADLYALGVVLAELLRGGRLHGDATPEEIARRTLEEPPPDVGEHRDDLPPALEEILFELLARDRDARPETARQVAQRLLSIATTLRAEEGPIDLGELMRMRFAETRRKNAAMLRAALDDRGEPDVRRSSAPGAPRGAEARAVGLHDEPTRLHAAPAAPGVIAAASVRRPERPWAAIGVAVVIVAALGLALASVRGEAAPSGRAGAEPAGAPAPAARPGETHPATPSSSPPLLPGALAVAPEPHDRSASGVPVAPPSTPDRAPGAAASSLETTAAAGVPLDEAGALEVVPSDAVVAPVAREGAERSRSRTGAASRREPSGGSRSISTWGWDEGP